MPSQVIHPLTIIVTIIDLSPELLLLLKVILNGDFLDELRVGAVMDNLCLAEPAPLPIGHLLEQNDEWVRLRAVLVHVQIGQALAPKAQLEHGGETVGCLHTFLYFSLGGGKDRRI